MRLWTRFAAVVLAAGAAWGADFLPLQPGNTWTYREAKTGQTFTMRVTVPTLINGREYYRVQGYLDGTPLLRLNEGGQLVAIDEENGIETPVTVFATSDSTWWPAPSRLCTDEGQTQPKRVLHDGPAGPIREVLEIRYRTSRCADAGVQSEQYAENIGVVRRMTDSIAGPRQFDLIYARVGKMILDAQGSGSLNVAAQQNGQTLAITLRLETPGNQAVRLSFSSAQEYDAVVRDAGGRAVWQWSADQMFAQSIHERSVSGPWTITLTAPVSSWSAGEYTVQGWLTTTGQPLQFAATVPVTIE
jgi:hypothetical protein